MENKRISYFGFFTKCSLLDNYGFSHGFFQKIGQLILPDTLSPDSFEAYVLDQKIDVDQMYTWENFNEKQLKSDIHFAIVSLVSRITSIGLDKKIKGKFDILNIDTHLFEELSQVCHNLERHKQADVENLLNRVEAIIKEFRKKKSKIGTSIQLTYKTRIIFQYLDRLRNLVTLHYNNRNKEAWQKLLEESHNLKKKQNLFSYIRYHFDLLLFQIVEHSSERGEKYIVDNRKEYFSFFRKSLIAGVIIAFFSLFKILLDNQDYSIYSNAMVFSANYALCFILVKKMGGVIATKQPAMTAATIVKKIDTNNDLKIDDLQEIVKVIKNTSRSQFISFIGNVSAALPVTLIIFYILNLCDFQVLTETNTAYLKKSILPSNWTNLYYAGIAGIFLSAAGLIAGYFDNKFRFSNLKIRFINQPTLSKKLSPKTLNYLGDKIDKDLAPFIGNIVLGVFLGSAFLIHEFLHIPFDIRHIAFSSSYLGALITTHSLMWLDFFTCFIGIWLIGTINFLVSFSITLFITIKTRGIKFHQLGDIMNSLTKELIKKPVGFLFFSKLTTDAHE